jgi:prophage tail gpP-like protein
MNVSLQLDGNEIQGWSRYEIESDMLTPADTFSLSVENADPDDLAAFDGPGRVVTLTVGGLPQLAGVVDEVNPSADRTSSLLEVRGRDWAGQLCDCSAPVGSYAGRPLIDIAHEFVRPWGLSVVADDDLARQRALGMRVYRVMASTAIVRGGQAGNGAAVQLGESRWAYLARHAARLGLHLWCSPVGELVLGRPCYDQFPAFALVRSGAVCNVLSGRKRTNRQGRFSRITWVSSRLPGLKIDWDDPEYFGEFERPLTVPVDAGSEAELQEQATRDRQRRIFEFVELEYVLEGHAQGELVYQPDLLVTVKDDVLAEDGVWYVVARRFTRSRDEGARTTLRLRRPGLWLG